MSRPELRTLLPDSAGGDCTCQAARHGDPHEHVHQRSRRGLSPPKATTDRWSASSTVEWVDGNSLTIARTPDAHSAPASAVRAKVHFRYEGRPKKRTFKGADMVAGARRFQTLLAAAHAHNWVADEKGAPVAPASFPDQPSPAAVSHLQLATPNSALRIPQGRSVVQDVTKVAQWSRKRHETRLKKSGEARRGNTNRDYAADLDFFLELARYGASDPRLAADVLEGQPWRLDDRGSRVSEGGGRLPAPPVVLSRSAK